MKSKENLTDQNKAAKKSFLIKKNGSNQSSVHNKTHAHNDVPPFQIEFVIMFYNNYCNAQLKANSRPLAICHVIQKFDVSIEDFHWHEKTILSSFKTDLDDWEDKDDKSKWVPCDGLLKRKKNISSISGSTTQPYSHMHFAWTIDFGLRIQKAFYKNKHEMSSLH